MEPISTRNSQMKAWLAKIPGLPSYTLTPMTGDASFRRYYRLKSGRESLVVMDAPPPSENIRPFLAVGYALQRMGLRTPDIYGADLDLGFLLLTDFGDNTYLHALKPDNADHLYGKALDALAILQGCEAVQGHTVPPFTGAFMAQEWHWHQDWVLKQWLKMDIPASVQAELDDAYHCLVQSAEQQPQVFMHRDYHAGNLMLLRNGGVGILDFQDAFIGPLTYDLASLLRDCYIAWPDALVRQLAMSYLERLQGQGLFTAVSEAQFLRWFDLMGVQRHLKAMMTFARKHVRDHDSSYLKFIPRTLHYIVQVTAQYPELKSMHQFYDETVMSAIQGVMPICVV